VTDGTIIADLPRSASENDNCSTRNGSAAPGENGNSALPAHRPATADGACNGKARAERRRAERYGITPRLLDFIKSKYGLNEDHARQMQLREVDEDEAFELVGDARAGIFIKFFDLDGKPNGHFQIRFYPTPTNPNGFRVAGDGSSRPKYRGPTGVTPVPYFSPFIDWKSIILSTDLSTASRDHSPRPCYAVRACLLSR